MSRQSAPWLLQRNYEQLVTAEAGSVCLSLFQGFLALREHELPIHVLVYADDLNMFGENPQTIRENIGILVEASKEIGLEVNPEKTKYIIMSRDENIVRNGNITIGNLSFEESLMLAGNEFQSLGRAIAKEDEYEEMRWDGIISIVSWRERVFRLWWEERLYQGFSEKIINFASAHISQFTSRLPNINVRRRNRKPEGEARVNEATFKYSVRGIGDSEVISEFDVCMKPFVAMHGIGRKKVERLVNDLKESGDSTVRKISKESTTSYDGPLPVSAAKYRDLHLIGCGPPPNLDLMDMWSFVAGGSAVHRRLSTGLVVARVARGTGDEELRSYRRPPEAADSVDRPPWNVVQRCCHNTVTFSAQKRNWRWQNGDSMHMSSQKVMVSRGSTINITDTTPLTVINVIIITIQKFTVTVD
ncbi:hypothetical protein ANN_14183 [Periplaneta americana]|uniref:Reverse transcriptase domain-containing protein n=1 Tax=Periplaneta americana TaxID=6978 RepID=A0ABQ8SWN3_PERAM|nr:hypothetical protein ANN_14183 [Periplaneta americana]